MRWTFLPRASRRDVITEVLSDRHHPTVDFAVRRNLIWTVKRGPQGNVIIAFQLRLRSGFGWGFRAIAETVPPRYHDCPISFLDRTPVASSHWRRQVRAHHARRALRTLTVPGAQEGRAPAPEAPTIIIDAR